MADSTSHLVGIAWVCPRGVSSSGSSAAVPMLGPPDCCPRMGAQGNNWDEIPLLRLRLWLRSRFAKVGDWTESRPNPSLGCQRSVKVRLIELRDRHDQPHYRCPLES